MVPDPSNPLIEPKHPWDAGCPFSGAIMRSTGQTGRFWAAVSSRGGPSEAQLLTHPQDGVRGKSLAVNARAVGDGKANTVASPAVVVSGSACQSMGCSDPGAVPDPHAASASATERPTKGARLKLESE